MAQVARPGSLAGPWKSGVDADGYCARWRRYPGGGLAAIVGRRSWAVYTPSGREIARGLVRGGPMPTNSLSDDGPACERAADMHLQDRGLL